MLTRAEAEIEEVACKCETRILRTQCEDAWHKER